jgi:hypothetical protein
MENFFAWITVPVPNDEAEIWFNKNNMIIERRQLYGEFCISLFELIKKTYLGQNFNDGINPVIMTKEENNLHFDWCWNKTIENFSKENIKFKAQGEHKDYLKGFFDEVFYYQEQPQIADNVDNFLSSVFDESTSFTKSDLDMITEIYMLFEKSYI